MKIMTTKMHKREGRAGYVFGGMNMQSLLRRHGVAWYSASEVTPGSTKLSAFKNLKEAIVAQA